MPAPTRLSIFVALATIALSSTSLTAQDSVDSARATIRRIMAEQSIPSVAVAVAKGGKIVWEEGFGWADKERRIAATSTTMYSLASISKPITATGLMVQVVRGKVGFDKPANTYLDAGKLIAREGDDAAATVRLVANHTSGLPLHYQFYYEDRAFPRPTMDEAIAHYGILVAPPGAQFTYSNLGYGILERIIERTSGTAFETFMDQEVFRPLGLSRMAMVVKPIAGDSVAVRYDANGASIPWYDFDHRGASAVYSSARDLARFGMFHLGDRVSGQREILAKAALDSMHRATSRRAEKVGYGFGWQTFEDDFGEVSHGHSGGMPGVSTQMRIYPASDVVIVVLTNSAAGGNAVPRMAAAAGATVMAKYAERVHAGAPPPQPSEPFQPPANLVGDWTGAVTTWDGAYPVKVTIAPDGTATAALGSAQPGAVTNLRLQGDRLTGSFAGTVPTSDAGRESGPLLFDVRIHDDKLSGSLSATAANLYALSSYLSLQRHP